MRECIIIGGGVAGLSAAIHLSENGPPPLLIEAGKYPGHRLCGEFFSPECLPILKNWGLTCNSTITSSRFIFGDKEVYFTLPQSAGGLSRYNFDQQLLEKAQSLGAEIRTETQVTEIIHPKTPSDYYTIHLSDGSYCEAKQLMIGTGRLPQLATDKPKPIYMGFKSHFSGNANTSTIEMHCFQGGYVGVSPVSPTTLNMACIVRLDQVNDPTTFMDKLATQKGMQKFHTCYSQAQRLFPNWITATVPEFGLKQNPSWPNVYWIGDAAGTIPPVCGDGLGIALTTGIMAADYLLKSDANSFKKDWLKRYRSRFFWGKALHHIVTHSSLATIGAYCCNLIPALPKKIFLLTRES